MIVASSKDSQEGVVLGLGCLPVYGWLLLFGCLLFSFACRPSMSNCLLAGGLLNCIEFVFVIDCFWPFSTSPLHS